jgi:hypothetical protein
MDYAFKPGDRVRLTRTAIAFYGGAPPHWVPQNQGGGTDATVLFAGDRPHKPGAAPRPYFVRFDNGAENSYRVEDLEGAGGAEAEPPGAGAEVGMEADGAEGAPNVFAFNRTPRPGPP